MPRLFVIALAASLAGSLVFADAAFAQAKKKVTYEQAWKLCTAEINAAGVPRNREVQRQAAGAACMKKYGFRLKK
jgi:hypothetical protein